MEKATGSPRRRSLRLPRFDYRSPGAYFVTLVTHDRECLFGEVVEGELQLSALGIVTARTWVRLPEHFPHLALDAWVLMPNHVHGILRLGEPATEGESGLFDRLAGTTRGSLGAVIQSFKSISSRHIHRLPGASIDGPIWQRNYYEHIIRDEASLNEIRTYIAGNPGTWMRDALYKTR